MKKRIIFFNCSLVLLAFFVGGCDYTNYMLVVKNKSKRPITVLYANTTDPDPNENNVAFYLDDYNIIQSDSSNILKIGGHKNAWHEYIQKGQAKELLLYVFDIDTLKRYPGGYSMNNLRTQGKYLKILKYSEQDLDRLNWLVTYK